MADNVNNKSANHWDYERGEELDRALDAVLATYAAIEPRAGLDERILARLESAPKSHSHAIWWRWSAAAVLAMMTVTISLVWRWSRPTQLPIATRPAIQKPEEPNRHFASNTLPNRVSPKVEGSPRRTGSRHIRPAWEAAAQPKLDVFPSSRPLTKEELALVRYVQSFPKEATLIAQRQEEFDVEAQREMNNARSQNRPSDSIQEER
jgi:hypothetical protein